MESPLKYKSNRYCSIANCNSRCTSDISLFLFPKDRKLKKKWSEALKLSKPITKYMYVCSLHFCKNDLILPNKPTKRRRLKKGAVPFINMSNKMLKNIKNQKLAQARAERLRKRNSNCNNNTEMSALKESETITNGIIENECRACLERVGPERNVINLFQPWAPGWSGMGRTIAEDLAKLANVEIKDTDRQTKLICDTCTEKLQHACMFMLQVQQNDWILRERHPSLQDDHEKVWPKPIQIDKTVGLFESPLEVKIKQEVVSDDEYAHNTEDAGRDMDYVENLDIKVEPEELVKPQIALNGTISLKEFPASDSPVIVANGELHSNDNSLDVRVKEEPISETEDSDSIPNDLPLECMLCARSLNSVSGLKAHVIAHHSYKSVRRKTGDSPPSNTNNNKYVCATCRRTFSTSTDLMVHETCHNKDVCYGCNSKFDSFALLSNHRKRCKALASTQVKKPKTLDDVMRPQAEDSNPSEITQIKEELLECALCQEVFTDSYYMKIHQEVHHSKGQTNTITEKDPTAMEIEALESIFNENT